MCLTDVKIKGRDWGYMGATHALSALAIFFAFVAFWPQFREWAGLTGIAVIILAALVTVGGSLIPDLDNSASSAKSALGLVGNVLSVFFINSSKIIQTVLRTRRDDPDPNPHRGFWHTIPAALLLGGLTILATSIPGSLTIPFYGEVTWSWLVALVLAAVSIHLALAGLFNAQVKKIRKSSAIGELVAFVVSLALTATLFWFLPHEGDFWWLGFATALGVIIHILGDATTTAGVPLLFPISVFTHKKFWWTTRFSPIKAGGTVEKVILIPLFSLVTLISLAKIIYDMVSGLG